MFRKDLTTEDTENHEGARRFVALQPHIYVSCMEQCVIEIEIRITSRCRFRFLRAFFVVLDVLRG